MKRRRPKPEFAVEDMVYRLSRKFDYPDVSSRVASQRMDESQWGVFIHAGLTAAQTIPVNGDLLEWTGLELLGAAEEWNVVFPTTTLEIPTPGYYDIAVAFSWDTWESGGSVQVLRSLTAVWPPNADAVIGQWTYSLPSRSFHGVAKAVYCNAGDSISVFVDHEDSSTQDVAAAWITAELVDRVRAVVGQDLFIFLEDDTFDWHLAGQPETLSDVWIIGGGGGGAGSGDSSNGWRGGGGGGGGLNHLTNYAVSGDVAVVVGLGGNGGIGGGPGSTTTAGENSSFDGQVATGGGKGGIGTTEAGGTGAMNGGCGGGGTTAGAVSSGVGGTGSEGGDGGDAPVANDAGGGGGGIGGDGQNGQSGSNGGDGGIGIDLSSIVGLAYGDNGWFGGGGGANGDSSGGVGGQGGGGDGISGLTGTGEAGLTNSGGGGGAGGRHGGGTGGDGGSGIVIVKVR